MHISLVTDGVYPFVIGGMQKHSYYLAKYLSRHHKVSVYHFISQTSEFTPELYFSAAELNNISFVEIPFKDEGIIPGHYLRSSKQYSLRIYKEFMRREKSDLIIAKGFTAYAFVKGKENGDVLPPLCVNFHGLEMFQKTFGISSALKARLLRPLTEYILKGSDYVFSYGGKVTTILSERIGVGKQRIIELPSGIEEGQCSETATQSGPVTRFLFVGRAERRKGIKELTEALILLSGNSGWEMSFIGPIPEDSMYQHGRITYYGQINSKEKIYEIMRQHDVLICPSWSEGMPNVIIEAMSNGLAVVATDTGATSLLVSDDTGWMLKSIEPAEIASVLMTVVKTERGIVQLKKENALALIKKRFNWNVLSQELEAVLRKIVLK